MDNFAIIYKVLHYLEKAMDYDEADTDFISAEHLKLSDRRWAAIMEMLAKEGYVDGVSIKRPLDGEVLVAFYNPRITLKGLEYLKENSLMKKAANASKGIAEVIT
ncbi:MAG: YjcQ family protein [Clostridiales bacterium]|nr:YjcQ family protein [Clostridiales bacterium]